MMSTDQNSGTTAPPSLGFAIDETTGHLYLTSDGPIALRATPDRGLVQTDDANLPAVELRLEAGRITPVAVDTNTAGD